MPAPLTPRQAEQVLRPSSTVPVRLADLALAVKAQGRAAHILNDISTSAVTGLCLDSRAVLPGDLYAAVPGANRHGSEFSAAAAAAGASAILTDAAGEPMAAATGLPVLVIDDVREDIGLLAAAVYGTRERSPRLFGLTGTNGKTTTTYLIRSILAALGETTGLIGTIEIVAGETRIPSILTTPEAPQLHGLMARMAGLGIGAAVMEVSSHSLSYRRVDGLRFAVSGFTNLTQDHLDLHGDMEDYYATKASLFAPERSERAVITVDDAWGARLAAECGDRALTLSTTGDPDAAAQWSVAAVRPDGLGHAFELRGPGSTLLRARTGLPGDFNIANAALAVLMVLASGVDPAVLQHALDTADPLTVEVPGRMQVICREPAAIVDFAHNPDALARALESVRSTIQGSRVIVVFGATGQRDATKRPIMGAIAARHADIVIVSDDDPHDEEPAGIREAVAAGARAAIAAEGLSSTVMIEYPRAAAIAKAAALATVADTILVAGRGHEIWQEVKGVNLALDDREELRAALIANGFTVAPGTAPEPNDSTTEGTEG
ncbi:UDP-N-acetylmuramoyl-L-alanyl-D-glutamate--2,6-diaminopimelate ligase [Paeniglutamicibacter cryotolerans]|uniref:UDP-N-acetylmuramyl-tripeptide synthetase n=1 Tax=Paeniglutamicibacter cryotolerans TaxID=670079 RepID=A0A839QL95_9MICC|nr:UDP-N-acetylmuramoyl-L-alanyl-D-glutamate--2,6-diaminopimelate ligase [Paeniglutamicibacter cryotolerans]MBB2996627.1 UDP-N-acetylmuramoyl-L-alanyl-D-glutamate--2,6-diaminopimelate ligase [Paeniglutamicibacter cryotolerans]